MYVTCFPCIIPCFCLTGTNLFLVIVEYTRNFPPRLNIWKFSIFGTKDQQDEMLMSKRNYLHNLAIIDSAPYYAYTGRTGCSSCTKLSYITATTSHLTSKKHWRGALQVPPSYKVDSTIIILFYSSHLMCHIVCYILASTDCDGLLKRCLQLKQCRVMYGTDTKNEAIVLYSIWVMLSDKKRDKTDFMQKRE